MKRVGTVLLALFSFSMLAAQASAATRTGWISDAMCGAKNMSASCVKKCIDSGQKPVFVDSSKQVWSIDNPDVVKSSYYGAKVTVRATEDASNKSVHIDSIKAAK